VELHPHRDQLLAEVHARPSTPIDGPTLVTRIAALSGHGGGAADWTHMAALCRRLNRPEPADSDSWCLLDAGDWRLRWERHSEFSSWTFFSRPEGAEGESAIDRVPRDWLDTLPGPILVLTTLAISDAPAPPLGSGLRTEAIGSSVMGGAAVIVTDLRPDRGGMTRYFLAMQDADPVVTGRIANFLLEIETYRLMALLAFPVAQETGRSLFALEGEVATLTGQISENLGIEDDRSLLARLVALSGRVEAMSASTSFRFGAARAYYDIVATRIAWLREEPLPGHQTIGEFIDRRVGPAMRTCASVAGREADLIARIARAGQMLNTRVELVSQAISAELLQSMDRRALMQLRLQKTVESLSVAAVSYYVMSLVAFPATALGRVQPWLRIDLLLAATLPVIVLLVWLMLRRVSAGIDAEERAALAAKPVHAPPATTEAGGA
jgi:uncharacterized membrane-anchored protein